MKNCFYFKNINAIGGVETFFYNIAKKYSNKDITIYYKTGDAKQIARLRQYVDVRQYKGEEIVCEKMFLNYACDILDKVKAKEVIQILHADYDALNVKPIVHEKITKYIGVSKQVCDSFEKLTGIKAEVCYNPVSVNKPEKVLHLISATRLSKEKGKQRMIALADALDDAGITYTWTIFTTDQAVIQNKNTVYRKPRLDITSFIAESDYLVQLSDTEGYGYAVAESLMIGTPVIVTPCPALQEIGVKDGVNGFVLPFDMKDIPVEKIAKGLDSFTYTPLKDGWGKVLAKGESEYQKKLKDAIWLECLMTYFDTNLNRQINKGEIYAASAERAIYLRERGVAREHDKPSV